MAGNLRLPSLITWLERLAFNPAKSDEIMLFQNRAKGVCWLQLVIIRYTGLKAHLVVIVFLSCHEYTLDLDQGMSRIG